MSNLIWECKTAKHSSDLYTYFTISISKSFSPQDMQNEIELFEKYLWDKYYLKDEKTIKQTWIQWIRNLLNSTKSQITPE